MRVLVEAQLPEGGERAGARLVQTELLKLALQGAMERPGVHLIRDSEGGLVGSVTVRTGVPLVLGWITAAQEAELNRVPRDPRFAIGMGADHGTVAVTFCTPDREVEWEIEPGGRVTKTWRWRPQFEQHDWSDTELVEDFAADVREVAA